ncbi:hypothetical protein N7499_006287 [Penicillium canescens]|nr:hypothetical protein N7499_006287 [Penicillium canescens]KAJ6176790.1 hypothetical protein N7485_003704 [Penicillium canescens]
MAENTSGFRKVEERAGIKLTLKHEFGDLDRRPDEATIARIVGDMTAEVVPKALKGFECTTDRIHFDVLGIHVAIDEVNGHWALSVSYVW